MRVWKTCQNDRNDIKTFENNTKISKMIVKTTENGFKNELKRRQNPSI